MTWFDWMIVAICALCTLTFLALLVLFGIAVHKSNKQWMEKLNRHGY